MWFRRLVVVVVVLHSFSIWYGYFEYKFRCTISPTNITVSLNKTWQKCLDYLSEIDWSLQKIRNDIVQAKSYVWRWADITYRTEVYNTLINQQNLLIASREQTIVAIDDFEQSLFTKIKTLLKFHLDADKQLAIQSIASLRNQLTLARNSGDSQMFRQLLPRMELLQYQLFLLNQIESSSNFEELVPFLKQYLYEESL